MHIGVEQLRTAAAAAPTMDGKAIVYGENNEGLRTPYYNVPTRGLGIQALGQLHSQWTTARSITGHARTVECVDAFTYLYYDGQWPTDPMAIIYLDPYPDRPSHPGDIRVNRRENPRKAVR